MVDFMQRDNWVVMGIKKLDTHLWHSYGAWLSAAAGKEVRYCKFCGVPEIKYADGEKS